MRDSLDPFQFEHHRERSFGIPETRDFDVHVEAIEMEVEHAIAHNEEGEKFRPGFHPNGHSNGGDAPSTSSNDDPSLNARSNDTPQSELTFNFPSSHTTPIRRRQVPPMAIPNFPSAHEHRDPQPPIPFSPSPTQSPAPHSPFRSPDPPAHLQSGTSRKSSGASSTAPQPFSAVSGVSSPWLSLAASSGAPTPSLEGGPMGRGSPHLGYPFERLNIGGSWSGANLWGEGAQGRRGSAESTPALRSSPTHSPADVAPSSVPYTPMSGGLSADTLARYRAMAGKTITPPGGTDSKDNRNAPTLQQPAPILPSGGDNGLPSLPTLLAKRRASLPKNSLGGLGVPGTHVAKSPSPLASSTSSVSPPPVNKVQPISPQRLTPLLSSPSTLVLDLRPPSSFQSLHIPNSHSLPIPSTLLRRPAFTLEKLLQMLAPRSQTAVGSWKDKRDIVILDVDSVNLQLGGSIDGLATKFEREGFAGQMWFVKGGHSAVVKDGETKLIAGGEESQSGSSGPKGAPSGLMARRLGNLAFQSASTGSGSPTTSARPTGLQLPQTPSFDFRSNPFGISMPQSTSTGTARPSGLTLNKDAFIGSGDAKKAKLQPANPFFDNIRQNLELSHGGITERIPLNLPHSVTERSDELPPFLRALVNLPEKESMDMLAKQFYDLELSEQKRLQAVMDWHSKGSGGALGKHAGRETRAEVKERDAEELDRLSEWTGAAAKSEGDYYPFSITAGVERGTKNRYKNIWPYDFSRVRLDEPPDEDSDYINASYVQPRGTNRRYIATQGPLDATFTDFWTLVWEQDVRVIVMITKQYEGGLLKCGNYWQDESYGPMRLHVISQSGGDDQAPQATTGFDFGVAAVTPTPAKSSHQSDVNIKRVFNLSRDDKPEEPARQITQIQCTGWPDFDVPDSPEFILNLIKEVDAAVESAESGVADDRKHQPPVLVHCSAGVGRTGSFIAIDAILDGLRREYREQQAANLKRPSDESLASKSTSASARPVIKRTISAESSRSSLGTRPLLSLTSSNPSSGEVPTLLSSSPASVAGASSASPGSNLPLSASNVASHNKVHEEMMDLDSTSTGDAPPSPPLDQFTRHRGSVAASTTSELSVPRRPSVVSFHNSSESVPMQQTLSDRHAPKPVTKSNAANRPPSPLSSMEDPIATVLHGMRVQRMSLVQTLRQYLFVHRAIIQNFLHMIDDDESVSASTSTGLSRSMSSTPSRPTTASKLSTTYASYSSAETGTGTGTGTDDEGHVKRRASPTELTPESGRDAVLAAVDREGSSLSKRPSFKKMRQGLDLEGLAPASAIADSAAPSSPKKGKARKGSRLVQEREGSQ